MRFFWKRKNSSPSSTNASNSSNEILSNSNGYIGGSEAMYNKHSMNELRENIENVYSGYFVLNGESDKEINLKQMMDENDKNLIMIQSHVLKETVHPYFGEVTLSGVSFEGVQFDSTSKHMGKIYFIVKKGEELRRICHADYNGEVGFMGLNWKIHHDIEQKGWYCEKLLNRWEFSHLGRDEEWMNEKLKEKYEEDIEPIVEKCIESKYEMISVLGAYNLQNILVNLEVKDLKNCYKSCKILRDLISSRDFLCRVIESQCVTLPDYYYQESQRNLRHCSMLELLKLYHERRESYSLGRKFSGSYVIWLNEQYWSTYTNPESEFGKTIRLNSVWWFDFGATLTLKHGHYKVSLRYKTNYEAIGLGEFNIAISSTSPQVEITSRPTCSFSSKMWTFAPLGEVTIPSNRATVCIQIFDHKNTYKSGLEIDCFQFEKV